MVYFRLAHNAGINCIPGPHYPGNSGDLAGTYAGIYRILCPRRPGTYPGLMRGDIFVKRAGNLLSRDVHIYLGRGPTRVFSRKMCPAVPGSTLGCTLDITKYKIESQGKSPLSPGSGGWGYHWYPHNWVCYVQCTSCRAGVPTSWWNQGKGLWLLFQVERSKTTKKKIEQQSIRL